MAVTFTLLHYSNWSLRSSQRFECWVKGEKEAGIRLLEKEVRERESIVSINEPTASLLVKGPHLTTTRNGNTPQIKIEGCWSSVISFSTVPNLSCPTSIVTLQGRVRILRVFEDIISSLKPQVECLRLRKIEFVNKVVLKVGMRFYDGIYNIVKGNDLRDGGIKSVTSRVNIWMGAIEACSGAGYVLRSIPMTTKLVESFEFLRSALVDDLVSQVVEVGKSLTSQYLVRSHALLEKSSLDELSEKVGTVGQHNELNEDMIKYSEAVESHFMPDPSPDLNAPLEFFKGVVDAVEGGGGDYGDEIIDGVSLEVFRPFMERIFDAPAIRRSGRRQVRRRAVINNVFLFVAAYYSNSSASLLDTVLL